MDASCTNTMLLMKKEEEEKKQCLSGEKKITELQVQEIFYPQCLKSAMREWSDCGRTLPGFGLKPRLSSCWPEKVLCRTIMPEVRESIVIRTEVQEQT